MNARARLCCYFYSLNRRIGGGWITIYIVKGDFVPNRFCMGNEYLCGVWRNRLPSLVKGHIPLCATQYLRKFGLCDAELFTDRFDSAHVRIIVYLLNLVNSISIKYFSKYQFSY